MPVKRFLVFSDDFEIGRIRNTVYRNQAVLRDYNPGSAVKSTITLRVKLDPDNTGWGPTGTDEFVVGVWVNNTSGKPVVEVTLHNHEYIKVNTRPVSLRSGDNYFYLEVNHGRANELGHAKGHVEVEVEVEYTDPNNPPSGNAPAGTLDKIINWVKEHPLESAAVGLSALFFYRQYTGKPISLRGVKTSTQKIAKKVGKPKNEEEEVEVNIYLTSNQLPNVEKKKEVS